MKTKFQWVAGALTLAFACTPLALAGTGMSAQSATAPAAMQASQMKAMSGYRHWTARGMMLLQQALTAQGFPVKADGKWGKDTRMALKNFQKKNGLKPTGYPNRATVKKLGLTLP